MCISGRLVCAVKHKPLGAGCGKTESCIDNARRLGARFCAGGFQDAIGTNSSAPSEQLPSFRVFLAVISYRNGTLELWVFLERFKNRNLRIGKFTMYPLYMRRKSGRAMGTYKTIIRVRKCA